MNQEYVFNGQAIRAAYDILFTKARETEGKILRKMVSILKTKEEKGELSTEEQTLLELGKNGEYEKFFRKFFTIYNPTHKKVSNVSISDDKYSYVLESEGNRKEIDIIDSQLIKKIEKFLSEKRDGESRAKGIIYEVAEKDILNDAISNFLKGMTDEKSLPYFQQSVRHIDNYHKDYEVTIIKYHNPGLVGMLDMDFEVKSNLKNFHVANASNLDGLNVSDMKKYLTRGEKSDYTVYDYLILKLLQEKFKASFPLFVTPTQVGEKSVLSASSIIYRRDDLYIQGASSLFSTQKQIKEVVQSYAADQISLPSKYAMEEAAMGNYNKLLEKVIQNMKTKTNLRCSLWYGRF